LRIKFWGVRGSVPAPLSNEQLRRKMKNVLLAAIKKGVRTEQDLEEFLNHLSVDNYGTYGGNTACVTVHEGASFIVLDAGTGLREFGRRLVEETAEKASPIHILLSHFHWDHIIGFPFFPPAFKEGMRIVIFTPSEQGREYFEVQQSSPFFPSEFAFRVAEVTFRVSVNLNEDIVGAFRVSSLKLNHPGGSIGYRVRSETGSVVYMTDTEIANTTLDEKRRYKEFVRGCDVVIIDSMYGLLESYEKLYWGHSAPFPFIDLFRDCNIKKLVLFHHDPDLDDDAIADSHERACRYYKHAYPDGKMEIICAYEGMEIEIPGKKQS